MNALGFLSVNDPNAPTQGINSANADPSDPVAQAIAAENARTFAAAGIPTPGTTGPLNRPMLFAAGSSSTLIPGVSNQAVMLGAVAIAALLVAMQGRR